MPTGGLFRFRISRKRAVLRNEKQYVCHHRNTDVRVFAGISTTPNRHEIQRAREPAVSALSHAKLKRKRGDGKRRARNLRTRRVV